MGYQLDWFRVAFVLFVLLVVSLIQSYQHIGKLQKCEKNLPRNERCVLVAVVDKKG